ncbi:hypothetical protein [Desulfogranum mediterraneum]|uniref:hypothetical protein n=1 Tax=Desulfogranum mediterraneum TaxID=160661 RepID=UPI0012948732|nr:hypothetical protein [Desulfogranum mediterraneum]
MKDSGKVVKGFEKKGKKIRSQARKQGLMVMSNRARLFIDGRPNRRWWFADAKSGILVSEEYGLCDDEALAKLARFRIQAEAE